MADWRHSYIAIMGIQNVLGRGSARCVSITSPLTGVCGVGMGTRPVSYISNYQRPWITHGPMGPWGHMGRGQWKVYTGCEVAHKSNPVAQAAPVWRVSKFPVRFLFNGEMLSHSMPVEKNITLGTVAMEPSARGAESYPKEVMSLRDSEEDAPPGQNQTESNAP